MLPETDAQKLMVDAGRVMGVVTGDKGRGRDGEELADLRARRRGARQGHRPGRGDPGPPLRRSCAPHFELDRDSTQTWELGVKEVWEVAKPLDRVIHTLGWPLRFGTKYHEYGGSWIYPMGEDKVSIGYVVGLDYADATLSAHDVLQQFKTHPLIRGILDGGRRLAWGAKTIPGGGLCGPAEPAARAGRGARAATAPASWTWPALKGVNYAIRSGILAAEAIYEALKAGKATTRPGSGATTRASATARSGSDLWKVRNIRPAFQKGFVYGGMVHPMVTASGGRVPKRVYVRARHEGAGLRGPAGRGLPEARRPVHFDKLSTVFASGNKTRDDQPSHIRVQQRVPRELAVAWE